MLNAIFNNPIAFFKGVTRSAFDDDIQDLDEVSLPTFDMTKEHIAEVMRQRSRSAREAARTLQMIGGDEEDLDDAIDDMLTILFQMFGIIRSKISDQSSLFVDCFFKLPLLRRLEEDMMSMELSE